MINKERRSSIDLDIQNAYIFSSGSIVSALLKMHKSCNIERKIYLI